jgi:two-component system nitrate/nitrite response regulator NarL
MDLRRMLCPAGKSRNSTTVAVGHFGVEGSPSSRYPRIPGGGDLSAKQIQQASQVNAIRALIVDQQTTFAEAIRYTLEDHGIQVVGVFANGTDALRAFRRERPDLVLLDLRLADLDGFNLGGRMLDEWPESKILVLAGLDATRAQRDAPRARFHAYLTKDTPIVDFMDAVFATLDGEALSPYPAARGTGIRSPSDGRVALLTSQLTQREREVLELLVAGTAGNGIARRLGISPNTVRTHVQSILTKLQVHSRLEAATFAVSNGIVSPYG